MVYKSYLYEEQAPDKLTCLEWVIKVWECAPPGVLQKFFKVCGIGVAIDGSKDGEIHCLRQGGMAADTAPEISRLTAEMLKAEATNLEDPFARLDDDDNELDTNELETEDTN